MSLVEKNAVVIDEREKEIVSIVQSISEINEMFRDLATMVVDQVSFVVLLRYSVYLTGIHYLNLVICCYNYIRTQSLIYFQFYIHSVMTIAT